MASTCSLVGVASPRARPSLVVDDPVGPAAVGETFERGLRRRACCSRSELLSRMIDSVAHVVAGSPLIFDVLQEFGIPRAVRGAGVTPEQDELRQQLAGELGVDIGHSQNIE